jgi:hypothetical protein
LARAQASNGTISKTSALKKDIHPKFYKDAKARRSRVANAASVAHVRAGNARTPHARTRSRAHARARTARRFSATAWR